MGGYSQKSPFKGELSSGTESRKWGLRLRQTREDESRLGTHLPSRDDGHEAEESSWVQIKEAARGRQSPTPGLEAPS